MEQRILGRTGVSVSKLCLGAMMFGAWGEPDHGESIRIIHAALDAGHDFEKSARKLDVDQIDLLILHNRGSTSSTPPTSTPPASPRRSSAKH
jgi:aryl-alcohol dehydrogenase-like predicted oxidoreductase